MQAEPTVTTLIPEVCDEVRKLKMETPVQRKLVYDRLMPFTRKLAKKFTQMDAFIGERAIRSKWVNQLITEAKLGRFLGEESALISCKCGWDGAERRVNGQHTAHMRLNMPPTWNPLVRVRQYYAKTDADFRAIYSIVDGGARRTSKEVVTAVLYGTADYSSMTTHQLSRLVMGIRLWKCSPAKTGPSIHDILASMQTGTRDLAHEVNRFMLRIRADNAPHMHNRAAVMAAMFATFERSRKDATEFWTRVRDGGVDTTHPAQTLMKYLISVKVHASDRGDQLRHKRAAPREIIYRACIEAWNAFRRGRPVNLTKELRARVPVV